MILYELRPVLRPSDSVLTAGVEALHGHKSSYRNKALSLLIDVVRSTHGCLFSCCWSGYWDLDDIVSSLKKLSLALRALEADLWY